MTRSRLFGPRRSWVKLSALLPVLLVACTPPAQETASEAASSAATVSAAPATGAGAAESTAEASAAATSHGEHQGHAGASSGPAASSEAASPADSAAELPLETANAAVTAVPPSLSDTVAYLTLRNPTEQDIVLVGAASPAAEHAMLMQTVTTGSGGASMSGMVETPSLTVPAGGELQMSSAGDHVMLMGLKEPLPEGGQVELTLRAEDGRTLTVQAEVQRP